MGGLPASPRAPEGVEGATRRAESRSPDVPAPFDDRFTDADLAAALRAIDDGAAGSADVAAPDPGRVAGHFAGVGDTHLLDLASKHASIRRLLVDVGAADADALVGIERDDAIPVAASGASARSAPTDGWPTVRQRALAAFGAGRSPDAASPCVARSEAPASEPRRVVVVASRRWTRVAVAASILALPAIGLALRGTTAEAASLAITGFDRVDVAGAVETEGPRRLAMGDRVATREGERIALRLLGGTRVVLGDRARMSIGCDSPRDGRCGGAVFDVERGGVAVSASRAGDGVESVALRVASAGRVDVIEGDARVDRDDAGGASLSLRADARVLWSPASGRARELVGPITMRLDANEASSPSPQSASTAAEGFLAFRDLDFFGGSVRRWDDETSIGARRWRIRADEVPAAGPIARGRRSEAGGAPAIRFDLDRDAVARVSWAADAPVFGARRAEIRFRAVGTAPRGVLSVRLERGGDTASVAGAASEVAIEGRSPAVGTTRADPVLSRVVIELPASFGSTSGATDELTVSFAASGAGAIVWFESVVFRGAAPSGEVRPPTRERDVDVGPTGRADRGM